MPFSSVSLTLLFLFLSVALAQSVTTTSAALPQPSGTACTYICPPTDESGFPLEYMSSNGEALTCVYTTGVVLVFATCSYDDGNLQSGQNPVCPTQAMPNNVAACMSTEAKRKRSLIQHNVGKVTKHTTPIVVDALPLDDHHRQHRRSDVSESDHYHYDDDEDHHHRYDHRSGQIQLERSALHNRNSSSPSSSPSPITPADLAEHKRDLLQIKQSLQVLRDSRLPSALGSKRSRSRHHGAQVKPVVVELLKRD